MEEIKKILESGILADYCLGWLDEANKKKVEDYADQYPEIQSELRALQTTLEGLAVAYARPLPEGLKKRTLEKLEGLASLAADSVSRLPLLSGSSVAAQWLQQVRPLIPPTLEVDTYHKVLKDADGVVQTVVWLKSGYPQEVHHHCRESFLILEGHCECRVGSEMIRLGPGDYYEIPLHLPHEVRVTRGPVLAIVQRLKAA